MNNKKKTSLLSINVISLLTIFLGIAFISVGYAALNANLTISGEATVLANNTITIEDIKLHDFYDAIHNDFQYTKNTTNVDINLLSENAYVTYEITIKNSTTIKYYLSEITTLANINNIPYKLEGINYTDVIMPNSSMKFLITFSNSTTNIINNASINLEYLFNDIEKYIDPVLNGADPVLSFGMIPVMYDENINNWVKANVLTDHWYSYSNQIWANSVTVTDTSRQNYLDSSPGTVIDMNDILTMQVWIPRYSYTIKDKYGVQGYGGNTPSTATPGAFDITFVNKDTLQLGTAKYTGPTPTEFHTPSSFCWGNTCDDSSTRNNIQNQEIAGFWVSKFEISYDNTNIYSKPNLSIWTKHSISTGFNKINELFNDNVPNAYGLNGDYDTHYIKNTEWGAIAYLSQSEFGKYGNTNYSGTDKEVFNNSCGNYITGIGSAVYNGSPSSIACANYTYETPEGIHSSTTGNIYGVYDMNGGGFERVMGVLSSGATNSALTTAGFPSDLEHKYLNIYPVLNYTLAGNSSILGDALSETLYFYGDRNSYSTTPWIYRGSKAGTGSSNGVYAFTHWGGMSDPYHSSRFTIVTY